MMAYSNFKHDSSLRLCDLLVQFQQGDLNSFENIIERFSWMISKASYNGIIGAPDDDLRSEILITLYQNLKKFVIPDGSAPRTIPDDRAADSLGLMIAQA